jgi:hypothetical protein
MNFRGPKLSCFSDQCPPHSALHLPRGQAASVPLGHGRWPLVPLPPSPLSLPIAPHVLRWKQQKLPPLQVRERVRLSPTGDPLRYPNPKWVSNKIPITSNRVPIWKTYFGCYERHNPNLSILSPGDPFAERVVFWVLLLEKTKNGY